MWHRLSICAAAQRPGGHPIRFAGVDEYTTKESNRLTRLPLYYGLTKDDRAAVVQVVKDFFAQK